MYWINHLRIYIYAGLTTRIEAIHCHYYMYVTDHVKLERLFNARTIERIAGIKITWTSNLADHLRLLDDDTGVVIFHNAFLKKMESRYETC